MSPSSHNVLAATLASAIVLAGCGDSGTKTVTLGTLPATHTSTTAAGTNVAAFVGAVDAILAASQPSYREINEVLKLMQARSGGPGALITAAEARRRINGVIANRVALEKRAEALEAPNDTAAAARDALAAAFTASLANDRAIVKCLDVPPEDQAVDSIFGVCLDQTKRSSAGATAAKARFRTAYNAVRHEAGLAPANPAF